MKLINAIEFSPFDFSAKEYEFPNETKEKLPEERDRFWRRCLADSNLQHLTPIEKGSYFVDIETLKDFELEVFVKKALSDIDIDELENALSIISGGVFVQTDNNFIITPNCCSDLGNLANWEAIFNSKQACWEQLWIGHPWIFYKRNKDFVEFSGYFEKNLAEISNIQAIHKIPEKWLQNEINRIRQNQAILAHRIKNILDKLTDALWNK